MKGWKEGRLRDIYVPAVIFLLVLSGIVIALEVNKPLYVAITLGNNAPIAFNKTVAINTSITLTDGIKTEYVVSFNVTDADGAANINTAAVGVNITLNGVKRSNNSGNCEFTNNGGDVLTRAYSCKVVFYYYDNASQLWEINLSAGDTTGAVGHNDSQSPGSGGAAHNVTVNSLSAFQMVQDSLVTSASLGDVNKELSFVVNNTGNFDFTLINVTPYDLNASLTDFFKLGYNFSINATQSTPGWGTNLTNATPANFTATGDGLGGEISAILSHKTSLITGQGSTEGDTRANRTLYIYIDVPNNKGLSTGVTYNASAAWEMILSTPS